VCVCVCAQERAETAASPISSVGYEKFSDLTGLMKPCMFQSATESWMMGLIQSDVLYSYRPTTMQ